MRVLNLAYDHPMELEERAAMLLAGGVMKHGYQCGMIWAATLAAGAQAYRLYDAVPDAEIKAVLTARKLVESFSAENQNINCCDITGLDKSSTPRQRFIYFKLKGGTIGCIRRAAKYANAAYGEINALPSDKNAKSNSSPVSCAAVTARKMGADDMHAVMTSGFAGGVGLCGGTCGALAAALWIKTLKSAGKDDGSIDFNDPEAIALIERFLKITEGKFECSEIVGRKFNNINDHADHIRNGGCLKIIESLTAG